MDLSPPRTLFGVDVIDSARTEPHLLPQVPTVLAALLEAGMDGVGIDRNEAVDTQFVGDGWLYAFPYELLGRVVDLGGTLGAIVVEHNKWNKPELRLRLAVYVGPLPDAEGFHPSNIARARLLEAPAFKLLARRCIAERPQDMSTAMILSDHAYTTLFAGDHTKVARASDFARLQVTNKEFEAAAWVSVHGFDARTLTTLIADDGQAPSAPVEERKSTRSRTVSNTINGDVNNAIVADIVNGGVIFGRTEKP